MVIAAYWATTENNASFILKRRRAAATVPFVSGPILTTGGTCGVEDVRLDTEGIMPHCVA